MYIVCYSVVRQQLGLHGIFMQFGKIFKLHVSCAMLFIANFDNVSYSLLMYIVH